MESRSTDEGTVTKGWPTKNRGTVEGTDETSSTQSRLEGAREDPHLGVHVSLPGPVEIGVPETPAPTTTSCVGPAPQGPNP